MSKKKRSVCPVACTLDLIGDKWTLLVVRDMACGKQYFNDFCRSPERIATNILAERLERLVAHGLAEKHAPADQPGRDAYRLTAKGKSLGPVLTVIAEWGLANIKGTKAVLTPVFESKPARRELEV
jgi:DNA-binding HxlR family transcriptional regulator